MGFPTKKLKPRRQEARKRGSERVSTANVRRSYDYICGSVRWFDSLTAKLLNLTHHAIQFVDEVGMIAVAAKRSHKGSVVP